MTVYTTLPTDDENLEVTVIDDPDLVVLNINPAAVSGGGGGSGTVTNVDSGTGLTGGPITTTGTISIDETSDITFNTVTATDEFIGHLDGSVRFTGKNRSGGTIEPGQVIYISGLSGNTPEVDLARSDSASTMPAFGIAIQQITDNNNGQFATFGSQRSLDISDWGETGITFSTGDVLYVSSTQAGRLTNVAPAGESNLIQNIGKLERATPSSNTTIKVGGAGRSNDTPNLNDGNIFIGDSNNNAITNSLDSAVGALGYIKTETDNQTLSFSNPDLSISNGNSVDLSALTPTSMAWSSITGTPTTISGYGITDGATLDGTETLTEKTLTDPYINGGYFDVLYATNKFEFATEYSNPAWSIYNNQFAVNTWKDSGNNLVLRQRWETNNGHSYMQYDVVGTADDGTGNVDFSIKGDAVQLLARNNSGGESDLTIDGSSINFFAEYEFPTTDGTANQVLQTDGNGQLSFATVSGGGSSTLGGLTDVDIQNVQNNDLLMYNSTAGEWQNTNLGVSVTPTLTGDSSTNANLTYTLTVSNHATYDDPAYFVEVYTGSTRVVQNSDVTDNGDGTLSFTAPATGTHEIRVRAQDFGDLQSEIATKSLTTTAFGGNYRYWKITGVTCSHGNWWMLANMRLFDATGQSGNAYPANMTTNALPTPYVIATNNNYNASYHEFKAFDSNTTGTFYWTIGSTNGPADWLTIDLGAAVDVKSMTITSGNGATYAPTGFELYASSTGAFSGEEVLIHTASGLPSVASQVTNIG